jgi:hypothetical protein
MSRQPVKGSVRRMVAERVGAVLGEGVPVACHYCGAEGSVYWPRGMKGQPLQYAHFDRLHLDHVVPVSQGGESIPENLVLACEFCNCSKHSRTDWTLDQRSDGGREAMRSDCGEGAE